MSIRVESTGTAGTLERVSQLMQPRAKPRPTIRPTTRRRVSSGVLALSAATALPLITGALSPAAASPSTWQEPDNPGLATVLLVLGGSIVGIIAVIALLVYLPSMMGRGGSGDLVYSDPEWFGGPRSGPDPRDGDAVATDDAGGSGARW